MTAFLHSEGYTHTLLAGCFLVILLLVGTFIRSYDAPRESCSTRCGGSYTFTIETTTTSRDIKCVCEQPE